MLTLAVEYIYVNPAWKWFQKWESHSAANPYGHSAVRYTLPSGNLSEIVLVARGTKAYEYRWSSWGRNGEFYAPQRLFIF